MGTLRLLAALLLAAPALAVEVVSVQPIAGASAVMGVGAIGTQLAAPIQAGLPSSFLPVSVVPQTVQAIPLAGTARAILNLNSPTLGLVQGFAARAQALAGSDAKLAGELGTAFENSGARPELQDPPAAPAMRDLAKIERFRFGTYNMLNLFEKVGEHVPDPERPGKLKKVSDAVAKEEWQLKEQARAILESDLDVMSVQEVENVAALKDFVDRYLGSRYRLFLIEGNDERGIDVAFIVKNDLPLEIEHITHKDETWRDPMLGNRETKLFSRDLPELVVRVKGVSKPLFALVGTHYKSKRDRGGGDHESNGLRRAQVERTAQIIGRMQAKYGKDTPILLAGDFNGRMNHEPEFEALKRTGLIDAFDALPNPPSERDRITHTYHPRGGPTQAHQMDAVMIVSTLKNLIKRAFVYRYKDAQGREKPIPRTFEERSKNPSDHFPVVVEMEFQPLYRRVVPGAPLAAAR
ncbi:MAG: hypothetical protein HY925_11525 [Elusimicrobia bacterium]|nr:hypothetical protein [Elusimicrobiota bacterium]